MNLALQSRYYQGDSLLGPGGLYNTTHQVRTPDGPRKNESRARWINAFKILQYLAYIAKKKVYILYDVNNLPSGLKNRFNKWLCGVSDFLILFYSQTLKSILCVIFEMVGCLGFMAYQSFLMINPFLYK